MGVFERDTPTPKTPPGTPFLHPLFSRVHVFPSKYRAKTVLYPFGDGRQKKRSKNDCYVDVGIKNIPQITNRFKNPRDTPKSRASDDFDQKWIYRPIRSIFIGQNHIPTVCSGSRLFRELFVFVVHVSVFIVGFRIVTKLWVLSFCIGICRKRGPHRRFSDYRQKTPLELLHRNGY